jgi:hypothetical protein
LINQRFLTAIRLVISSYLVAVTGVVLKYKLEVNDSHTRWRIPFQFSSITIALQLAYNLQVTVSSRKAVLRRIAC